MSPDDQVVRTLLAQKGRLLAFLRRVKIDGQPLAGWARSLGISPSNASVRLLRARRALLDRLRATCGACFEHGCLDCFCRTAKAVGSGAARPPPRDREPL